MYLSLIFLHNVSGSPSVILSMFLELSPLIVSIIAFDHRNGSNAFTTGVNNVGLFASS